MGNKQNGLYKFNISGISQYHTRMCGIFLNNRNTDGNDVTLVGIRPPTFILILTSLYIVLNI